MDFFEAQARAKKRTNRLVVLFAFAVLGTILAGYAGAMLFVNQREVFNSQRDGYYSSNPSTRTSWWNPKLFLITAGGTLAVVGFASLYKWSQMRGGGPAIAEMAGGRRVDPQTSDLRERQLLNVVEEMSIASGISVPAVYILDQEPALNAFAAGLNTSDAAVAVTRGTLEKLTRDELQGVIAHEFSHILNGDMRLNVRITAIVFGILVIGLIGRGILYSLGRGRVRSSGKKGGNVAALIGIGIALMVVGYIGYFFGRLIQAAVSRQREFLADASAVQFTRNPTGISGALKKIGGYALGGNILNAHGAELGHFFFSQAFKSNFGGLWATHPPLDERIRAVEPNWDGKLFEPKTVVDVKTESFRSAGHKTCPLPRTASGIPPIIPSIPFAPAAIVANIGALTETHFSEAQDILQTIPPELRAATRDPAQAPALIFAAVLGASKSDNEKSVSLIRTHASAEAAERAAAFVPQLAALPETARLPLLQLCLPALRALPQPELDKFATALDELVHADAEVTTFEFALHKMILHQLESAGPAKSRADFHSFHAVADAISIILSFVARTGQRDEVAANAAFSVGAKQLPLIADKVALLPAGSGLEVFSEALDRVARGSLPIKKRLLIAVAETIGADGKVTVEESELFRALSATLDIPMSLPSAVA
ncbi:M48 family metallopeptidase [Oleiharenicola lentus]|uniref:M48 family metallopeptidase n=1 Tax=Oleiharenicola lentus TaxID=2508720 RepID=UPI003F67E421